MLEDFNYITFLLGADDSWISQELRYLKGSYSVGMDELYDFCKDIASDFIQSDLYKDTQFSLYTAFEKFLTENETTYIAVFKDYFENS